MLKTKENFNLKLYNHFDTSEINKIVSSFSDEWLINTSRQDEYYPHKETESYFIYETDIDWKFNNKYIVSLKSNNKILNDLIEPIIKYLEELHDGKRGQVILIKLAANKSIADHKDSGDYLMSVHRHHIAIQTSPNTKFFVGDEEVNMRLGDCWEINNSREHAVINNSNKDRVHLLIDIMPYANII